MLHEEVGFRQVRFLARANNILTWLSLFSNCGGGYRTMNRMVIDQYGVRVSLVQFSFFILLDRE